MGDAARRSCGVGRAIQPCRAALFTKHAAAAPPGTSRGPRRPNDVEVLEVLISLDGTPPLLTGMRVDDAHAKRFPNAPVIEKPYDAALLLSAVQRALVQGQN